MTRRPYMPTTPISPARDYARPIERPYLAQMPETPCGESDIACARRLMREAVVKTLKVLAGHEWIDLGDAGSAFRRARRQFEWCVR